MRCVFLSQVLKLSSDRAFVKRTRDQVLQHRSRNNQLKLFFKFVAIYQFQFSVSVFTDFVQSIGFHDTSVTVTMYSETFPL